MLYVSNIAGSLIYITNTKDNRVFSMESRQLKECLASTGMRVFGAKRLEFSSEAKLDPQEWIIQKTNKEDKYVLNNGCYYRDNNSLKLTAYNYSFEIFPEANLPYDMDIKLTEVKKIMAKNKLFGINGEFDFNLIGYDAYSSTCTDIGCTIKPNKRSVLRDLHDISYRDNKFEGWHSITHDYRYYKLSEVVTIEIPNCVTRLNGFNLLMGTPTDVIVVPKSVKFIDSAGAISNVGLIRAPKELERCLSDCNCIKIFY